MTAQTGDRIERFARLTAAVRSILRRGKVFKGLAGRSAELEAGLEVIDRKRSDLRGSLWILILGGTGVGKSTLLGALAGREIAPVSPRRPTTTKTTLYAYEGTGLAPLSGLPVGGWNLVTHREEPLRDKVVIDPPDFDSAVESNRPKLLSLLDVSDLVITLVDREKYKDQALFELLARHRAGKTFVHVVNKLDLGVPPEVVADFKAVLGRAGFGGQDVFTISALDVLKSRTSGRAGEAFPAVEGAIFAGAGDFQGLERLIAEELDQVRIREIKRANIESLLRELVSGVRKALGEDVRGRLARFSGRLGRTLTEGAGGLKTLYTHAVLRPGGRERADSLRNYLRALEASGFSGVFGIYLSLSEKLRSLSGRGRPRAVDGLEAQTLAAERARSTSTEAVSNGLAGLRGEILAAARETGLDESALASETVKENLSPGRLTDAVSTAVGRRLRALTEEAALPGKGRARNFIYNLLPTLCLLAIPAYAGYALWTGDAFMGTATDVALMCVLAAAVLCVLQGFLVERSLRRGTARVLAELEGEIASSVEGFLEGRLLPQCRSLLEEAEEFLSELEDIVRDLGT